ncbi:Transcription factor gras [Thalictrum thalictroides]|uniref:Transcription factor gras n=1 Tax=Thalictrum thalictroides TaxID=46969 RepID=A0A7J6V664_THATH|nr:Transcription factor gras [Thalictrum thalictroides]
MAEDSSHIYNIPLSTSPPPPPPPVLTVVSSSDQQQQGQNPPSSAAQMRRLLITCADFLSQSNFSAAHRLVSFLSSTSSPHGDSTERLVHQFARALCIRLNRASASMISSSTTTTTTTPSLLSCDPHPHFLPPASIASSSSSTSTMTLFELEVMEEEEALLHHQLQSSFICLNQVTPFIRFSHLTANQAILEAIEGQDSIHILDFDTIMQGVQWPPLMQAIADRSNPPNMIRITGIGYDLETLARTGQRLENFAKSLGLRFHFHPLLLLDSTSVALQLSSSITLLQEETLVINCVLYLHRLLNRNDDDYEVRLFLHTIKAMNPKVVTLAEREANLNNPLFSQRFLEALDHYTALFDSMEATLPPNNTERLAIEQVWLGREIVDVVSAEGEERKERYERFQNWAEKMRRSGFSNVPLSPFAVSQAKLLLRLHYPSEGYQLHILNDSLFLGWQNHALFSVSSWH